MRLKARALNARPNKITWRIWNLIIEVAGLDVVLLTLLLALWLLSMAFRNEAFASSGPLQRDMSKIPPKYLR
jgi:hypothetical protein